MKISNYEKKLSIMTIGGQVRLFKALGVNYLSE